MAISIMSPDGGMGVKDWFKKKGTELEKEEISLEPEIDLPEMNKESLISQTMSEFALDDVELEEEEVVEVAPEYDSGDVDVNALLDDEMESNYDLNTVEETEFEDLLADAEIIGDLPDVCLLYTSDAADES